MADSHSALSRSVKIVNSQYSQIEVRWGKTERGEMENGKRKINAEDEKRRNNT